MPKNLVIVESPTKAKTITKFLGSKYQVESSFGHTRDLPKSKMGVDVENNFEPKYVIPTKVRKNVTKLKKLAEKAPIIYFATDEDREGEAISWHLAEIFKTPKDKIKRIVFHEITKEAILEALDNPRGIDMNLVDAQQARRIVDRLVGYELSPFLWKKVVKGLSAGRVQSVAVRLVIEREREIKAFKPDEYWTIDAKFLPQSVAPDDKPIEFESELHKIDGKIVKKLQIKKDKDAKKIIDDLKGAKYSVLEITQKESKRSPLPPYTTSTLQQDANRRLGYGPKQTMIIAQQLYEGIKVGKEQTGLITYMRTDSVNLADKFLGEAKDYITENFGKDHGVSSPRKYKTKSKGAQEAHEAIRPTSAFRDPHSIKEGLDPRQYKLYKLIWQRAVASQMAEAVIDNTTIDIKAGVTPYTFQSKGTVIKFDGFLKVWPGGSKEAILPQLKQNDPLDLTKLKPYQHFTKPPARYSEAGLVKVLEEHGIGRPSTYAPTIATIQARNYVQKEERRLKPTEIAFMVNDLLVEHFPKIVDYEFTAKMEDDLDEIAEGKQTWQKTIKEFYMPFKKNLEDKYEEVSKTLTEEKTDEVCDKCGKPMIIKTGRFGKFMACTGFPECKNTKPIDGKGNAKEEKTDEKCKKCGSDMVIKHGRFGKFLACSKYPDCKTTKQIVKSTGMKCPACEKGEIVQKRGRGGKSFYACDEYPDCKQAYWSKPTGKKCPDCGSLVVYGANETERCSSKECKYTADLDKSAIKDSNQED
ncbi:type I DNA topoisomerase [Patescibacteria group bacterium]|nr:type I DNA topoisomerase [Patescibacteria group bacterium]